MSVTKKIPCRVCGKMFKPCTYCQSNSDTFRWRNFACSKECAEKYINETIAFRANKNDIVSNFENNKNLYENVKENSIEDKLTPVPKRKNKKSSSDKKENNIEYRENINNGESEQIE